jgi:ATP-dependent Clp protease ATP-binding subunit ClpC
MDKVLERLNNNKLYPTFRKNLINHIAETGFDPKYGARPILRAISKEIEDNITKALINNEININEKFIVEYKNKKINIKPVKK